MAKNVKVSEVVNDGDQTVAPRRERVLKKRVTLQQIKLVTDVTNCFTIKAPIYQDTNAVAQKVGGQEMAPPFLMQVVDEDTGEYGIVVVPTVLHGELDKNYPDNSYVDKSFEITQRRIQGRKYNTFDILEVELV